MTISPSRRLAAEFLGTAFLVAAVVGSGVMGERPANRNVALALLANTIATGCGSHRSYSYVRPHLGAHLNPVATGNKSGTDWEHTTKEQG